MDLACDAKMENRHYDADGRLHILRTPISKATVNPYYGREIPNGDKLGLSPDKVYQLLRDPGELAKAAPSFARNQLMFEHTAVSSADPKQDSIAGTVGSDVVFEHPYLIADLCVWDADAIAGIETDTVRELSSSYRYRADMTPGIFEGKRYDGVMRDIQGNHVALVKQGRAGSDVMAADSKMEKKMATRMGSENKAEAVRAANKIAGDEDDNAEEYANIEAKTPGPKAKDKKARDKKAKDWEYDGDPKADDKRAKDEEDDDEDQDDDDFDGEVTKLDPKEKELQDNDPEGQDKKAKDKRSKRASDKKAKDCTAEDEGRDSKSEDSRRANDSRLKRAMDEYKAELKQAEEARRDVRQIVGDVLAYDTAEEIYSFALDEMKVDRDGVSGRTALRALFNAAKGVRSTSPKFAYDSESLEKTIPGANRYIRVMA